MILVTVGTNEAPFDRLLRAVSEVRSNEPLVVQHGPSAVRPLAAACFDFMPYVDLLDYARAARVVVAHAGAGSMLMAVHAGKRPIVMPRLRRHHEAVDDHQLRLARRMAEIGLADVVEDAEKLSQLLNARDRTPPNAVRDGSLALDLRAYLADVIGPPGSGRDLPVASCLGRTDGSSS